MAINKTTTAVRTGIDTDRQYGSVTPPLYLSSNFSFEDFAQPRQYDYTRSGNPTRDQLGKALANLEDGYDGVITSSGMSAIYLVTHLLDKGDVIIAPHDCYGGSYRLFKTLNGIETVTFLTLSRFSPCSIYGLIKLPFHFLTMYTSCLFVLVIIPIFSRLNTFTCFD